MTRTKRILLAAAIAGVAGLGSMSANAFWGSGPFGMFPGGWGGPGWGGPGWGNPWGWGGYPYHGGYPYYGGWGHPYGYGVPYGWGAPAYGLPGLWAPGVAQPAQPSAE